MPDSAEASFGTRRRHREHAARQSRCRGLSIEPTITTVSDRTGMLWQGQGAQIDSERLETAVIGPVRSTLGRPMLSDAELSTPVPTRLLSNDTLLVDQPMPLRDLITGLAEAELPGHTKQLLALLPNGGAEAGT